MNERWTDIAGEAGRHILCARVQRCGLQRRKGVRIHLLVVVKTPAHERAMAGGNSAVTPDRELVEVERACGNEGGLIFSQVRIRHVTVKETSLW